MLDSFFRPASVAIVGASPQRGSPRNTLVRNLLQHGFPGRIYPVSQSHAVIEELPAFRSVSELPEVPDVALVITPAETVAGVIAECGRKGVRHAIVYSSGFEEVGERGKVLARQLAETAREHGVRVVGPNCQGLWSVGDRTMLTFSPAVLNAQRLLHAPVAIVSQSGALAGAMCNALQRSGLGYSYVVSVGNETCIDALDALACVVEQQDVRAVALYIEGLTDAGRILAIAERARERGVQIVVLKSGRSAVGQQATASHTGKIASSYAIYSDILEQAGIITVDSLRDTVAALEALAVLPDPRSGGKGPTGLAIMSSSGGAGALLADQSAVFGVPLCEFSPDVAQRLQSTLPDFARAANPIDLTGQINTDPELFRKACEAVCEDPRAEALLVQFASSGRRYLEKNGAIFKELAARLPVIIGFIGETMEPEMRAEYRAAGVLMCADPVDSMQALAWIWRRRAAKGIPPRPAHAALASRKAPADWRESMEFLQAGGVEPAKWALLGPADRASDACGPLAFPVAVKVLPDDAEHKTELGLVRLRVASPAQVDAVAAEFRERLGNPQAAILVQEMAGEGIEIVLTCMRGTDFGPVLTIGRGGVTVELEADVVNLALPTTPQAVQQALGRLRVAKLLAGYRGKPAADVAALAQAAARLGDVFLAAPEVREVEINPVIVRPEGQGLRAVDVLVTAQTVAA